MKMRVAHIGAALLLAAANRSGAENRPNILWISCEDMSPDLGCYGAPNAHSTNLDKLAAMGTRYTRAFSNAPVCAPSRSSIITGMYATTIGSHHMRSKSIPPVGVKCFTEYLRAAGYYCTNNVKTDYNFNVPIAAWDETSKRAHWRNRPAGKPFFSVFNLTVTHESKWFMPDDQFEKEMADVPPELRHDPDKAPIPPFYPDTPVVRKQCARAQDVITAMDIRAGKILKELQDDGLASNTIVMFWSDHGRGMPRGKRWLYEYGTRVPLITYIPGQRGGEVREDFVQLFDLGPTVLSLAGLKTPPNMQGRVFLGDKKNPAPERLFFIRDRMDEKLDMVRAVRDKQYRYIRNFLPQLPYNQPMDYADKAPVLKELRRLKAEGQLSGPPALFVQDTKPAEEFYDIVQDPHCINNLTSAPEHQAKIAEMRKALDEWMKKTGDMGPIPEDEIQAKFFPDGKIPVTEKPQINVQNGGSGTSVTATILCRTEGASIVWKTGAPDSRWQLYTKPIEVNESGVTLQARASRAGYEDSARVDAELQQK